MIGCIKKQLHIFYLIPKSAENMLSSAHVEQDAENIHPPPALQGTQSHPKLLSTEAVASQF